MRNIDKIFEVLDDPESTPTIPLGIIDWQNNHTAGDHVFDARILYQFNETHRFALIVSNVANREYAIRPLTIEKPRTTVIQYTISI